MTMLAEMSAFQALVFLNAANILYLICYALKDVLWLRIFCVIAMCTIMPYYIWGVSEVQYGCIWWNVAFMTINLYWIVVIISERKPPKMSVEQKRLYQDVFERSCSPRDMLKLLSVASWIDFPIGERIVNCNSNPNGLVLIDSGVANVISDGQLLAELARGDFVGEMSYLTGEPAVADVVAASTMRIIRWETKDLEKLFEGRSELKSAINEIIGRDLIDKIVSRENKLPELSVDTVIS